MAKYIKYEDAEKKLFNIIYEEPPYFNSEIKIRRWVIEQLADLPSIDIDKYIPIKYVQDFCKDCADEGIGTVSTYMEDAGEAILKSWLAVKDTDFGKKYKR